MLSFYLMLLEDAEDKALFCTFHHRYERKMYTVALAILHSAALAEEAVQEAMLAVVRHFETFKNIYQNSCHEIEPWCVTIVKRTAITILRKERRSGALDEDWDAPAAGSTEDESAYRRLVALIRAMPETYRAALELKCVAEYTNKEIAKALGISEAAANARISRGRALLIDRLKEEGYDREFV